MVRHWLGWYALFGLTAMSFGQSESFERGRLIYEKGRAASGRSIMARLGGGSTTVPATAMACIGCHGEDGRGRSEGGLTPSDITWEALTRPYTVVSQAGRRRPPYNEGLFKRAVMTGIDSARQSLHGAMPRFELTIGEANDLIEFLKGLSTYSEPGIEPNHLRVGVILAPDGFASGWNQQIREAISQYVDYLNRRGGFFGRSLEVAFCEPPANRLARLPHIRTFLDEARPFALCASYVTEIQDDLARLLRERGLPLVGAHAIWHPNDRDQSQEIFYLFPSTLDLAMQLLDEASQLRLEGPIAMIASPQQKRLIDALSGIMSLQSDVKSARLRLWVVNHDPVGQVSALLATNVDRVINLGLEPEFEIAFFRELATRKPEMIVSSLGPHSGPGFYKVAARFRKASLIWPRAPFKKQGNLDLGLGTDPSFIGLFGLASLEITTNALAALGRNPTRSRLVDQLEQLFQFESQFAPPLTFHPNRRVGSRNGFVHIVKPRRVDLSGRQDRMSQFRSP